MSITNGKVITRVLAEDTILRRLSSRMNQCIQPAVDKQGTTKSSILGTNQSCQLYKRNNDGSSLTSLLVTKNRTRTKFQLPVFTVLRNSPVSLKVAHSLARLLFTLLLLSQLMHTFTHFKNTNSH